MRMGKSSPQSAVFEAIRSKTVIPLVLVILVLFICPGMYSDSNINSHKESLKAEVDVFEICRTSKIGAISTVWPSADGRIKVDRRYYMSSDLGKSWHAVDESIIYDCDYWQLGHHPADPETLYRVAGEIGISLYLEYSKDGGNVWHKMPARIEGTNALLQSYNFEAFHPTDPSTLFVMGDVLGNGGTNYSGLLGLYATHNKGSTFNLLMASNSPIDFAISKSNPAIMYMSVFRRYLLKSENAGQIWSFVGPSEGDIQDCNALRRSIFRKTTGPEHVIDEIAISSFNSEMVFAQTDRGIWKTTNGGDSWCLLTPAADPKVKITSMVVAADQMKDVIMVGTEAGLFVSRNDGASWTQVDLRAVR